MSQTNPPAIAALDVPPKSRPSILPDLFAGRVAGREKRGLGDFFALSRFGVNLTRLEPGAISALRHSHSHQDEFIYILEGHPTLVTGEEETPLTPGMCAGFKAGTGVAHQLQNRSDEVVLYLEVGDRAPEDQVSYPDEDLLGVGDGQGAWRFVHKDGTPY